MTLTQLLILGKKFKAIADGIYALSTLFVVPCIVVTPVLWYLQKPPEVRSHVKARSLGEGLQELQGDIDFNEGPPLRVAYHLELIDHNGKAIKFPRIETRGVPRFDNMLIPIPASIKPGDYQLVAKVQYTVNPIKAVAKEIPVTTITVN